MNRRHNRIAFRIDWLWALRRPWRLVDELYHESKWFVQRGLYGYSECDVWNLAPYLCKWLPSALRDLADEAHGFPSDPLCEMLTLDQWKAILEKMAVGFEAGIELFDYSPTKTLRAKHEEGMALFSRWFFGLWD